MGCASSTPSAPVRAESGKAATPAAPAPEPVPEPAKAPEPAPEPVVEATAPDPDLVLVPVEKKEAEPDKAEPEAVSWLQSFTASVSALTTPRPAATEAEAPAADVEKVEVAAAEGGVATEAEAPAADVETVKAAAAEDVADLPDVPVPTPVPAPEVAFAEDVEVSVVGANPLKKSPRVRGEGSGLVERSGSRMFLVGRRRKLHGDVGTLIIIALVMV